MVDCRFQANSHVHMHVEEDLGTVALITRYARVTPVPTSRLCAKGLRARAGWPVQMAIA